MIRTITILLLLFGLTIVNVQAQDYSDCRTVTFDGTVHFEPIESPLEGLIFTNWTALNGGNYINEPSPREVATWFKDPSGVIELEDPTEYLVFVSMYSAGRSPMTLEVYDRYGTLLGSDTGPLFNVRGTLDKWNYLSVDVSPHQIHHIKIVGRIAGTAIDDVTACRANVFDIKIDIKPGSTNNSINLKSNGTVPVSLLGSDTFDVSEVDQESVLFADAAPKKKGKGGKIGSMEDTDGDGYMDLVFHIPTKELALSPADTQAEMTGSLQDRSLFQGSDAVSIVPASASKRDDEENPSSVVLHAAYPNPFNPETILSFTLPWTEAVRLAVYDMLGHEVSVLVDGMLVAGSHSVRFDAHGLPSGMYMYRLETSSFSQTRSMVLAK